MGIKLNPVVFGKERRTIGYSIWCVGCEQVHVLYTVRKYDEAKDNPAWDFNGSLEAPTFNPSLLVWWDAKATETLPAESHRCHSYIREGRWEYLTDCTHALAGQNVEVPDWKGWGKEYYES